MRNTPEDLFFFYFTTFCDVQNDQLVISLANRNQTLLIKTNS